MSWCASRSRQSGQGGCGGRQGQVLHHEVHTSRSPPPQQVDVVRGSGRFVPRAPYADLVYARILQRDKVCQPQRVEREAYTGPVLQV